MTFRVNIPASKVLVTVGTASFASALGLTEAHRAAMIRDPNLIGFAAADAKLVTIEPTSPSANPLFRLPDGTSISLDEIEGRWGARLREDMGIRFLRPDQMLRPDLPSDIGAPLAHRLEKGFEDGGLRDLGGLRYADIRASGLKEMGPLFTDDHDLGPSLQAQLFVYAGLMALAGLADESPLGRLTVPNRFRIAAAFSFTGQEAYHAMARDMGLDPNVKGKTVDKLASRLAYHLPVDGPALLSTMISPSYPLSRVRTRPGLLAGLVRREGAPFRDVPQAPLCIDANCAGTLSTLADLAPSLLFDYPGVTPVDVALLISSDAVLFPDARVFEGFGPEAVQTREKLGRTGRHVSASLAPFDQDSGDPNKAGGTVPGNMGAGSIITTLEFAMRHFLDITSIIVGWGQSGETGGKAHLAGVGYGGENALIAALMMAHKAFGLGVEDFDYFIAHATGTRSNSQTDLAMAARARMAVAEALGGTGPLPRMRVGAPKAAGPGHPMAGAGHMALDEGIHHVMGEPAVGIPTLRQILADLPLEADQFELSADLVPGSLERGFFAHVQGFGGYDGANAAMPATDEFIRAIPTADKRARDAFLERRAEIRQARIEREARWRRTARSAIQLANLHRWPGIR